MTSKTGVDTVTSKTGVDTVTSKTDVELGQVQAGGERDVLAPGVGTVTSETGVELGQSERSACPGPGCGHCACCRGTASLACPLGLWVSAGCDPRPLLALLVGRAPAPSRGHTRTQSASDIVNKAASVPLGSVLSLGILHAAA